MTPNSILTPDRRGLLRKLLIIVLLFIIAISAIALFSTHLITKKLQHWLSVIQNSNPQAEQASNVLLLLDQAESDFQLAVFSFNQDRLSHYQTSLRQAFDGIDSIRLQQSDSSFLQTQEQLKENQELFREKLRLSEQMLALKSNFDSLLIAAEQLSAHHRQDTVRKGMTAPLQHQSALQSHTDTLTHQAGIQVRKRGFFKRVRDVFDNRADTIRGGGLRQITSERRFQDSVQRTEFRNVNQYYQESFSKLRQQQQDIAAHQVALSLANRQIMDRMRWLIGELKRSSARLSDNIKAVALQQFRSTELILNTGGLISLVLVLLFGILLLGYIIRIRNAERLLQEQHEQVAGLAQQKTDLLATMSHEIRNPLNAIIGFLKILKSSGLSEHQEEMLHSIQLSSDMLLATVNDALDMTKLESGEFQLHPEQFNPYNTLRTTVDAMRFNAQNKLLTLDYEFEGDRQQNLIGDTFRLNQILMNLLSNAIKFTEQGSITVKANLHHALSVQVTDTGPGMPPEQQSRLFTKYYQASSSRGKTGTGLGLYLCRKLVQIQGGSISVNSEQGRGTSFLFTIPYPTVAVPAAQDGAPVTGQANPAATGSTQPAAVQPIDINTSVFAGKTLLLADDNELNQMLVQVMVSNWDVHLLLASNGQEAWNLLNSRTADVIMTDMEMPEMNGAELVARIRNSTQKNIRDIPVILITGNEYSAEEISQLQARGFTGILLKPFDVTMLARSLFAALHGTNIRRYPPREQYV